MVYPPLKIARKYFHYYLTAANGKGHGIHSPFVYEFVREVLNGTPDKTGHAAVEALRRQLQTDGRMLLIEDLGAGSASGAGRERSVGEITKRAAKPEKLGQLLHRMARFYGPKTIVELGTSMGLSTAYLSLGAPGSKVFTIEGSDAIAGVAEENFRRLGLDHIELYRGNFDDVLEKVLTRTGLVDMAFVDGNHRLEPTMRYFNMLLERSAANSVLIFDDIHWSTEMEAAWDRIKADPRVYLTVDLFFLGLVFRREEFKVKQDFVIRF